MSLKFQETLVGNTKTFGSACKNLLMVGVPYFANITIKHTDTGVFLHSHTHLIPLKHDDGRISSNGQQVNGYAHSDNNSQWSIEHIDMEYKEQDTETFNNVVLSDIEKERNVRYVRHNDIIRLRHITTNSYLKTHDVASPLTQTNMEIIAATKEALDLKGKYNDSLWQVVMSDANSGSFVTSKKNPFKLISVPYNVAVFSTKKSVLPDWGYKMQEVNGRKDTTGKGGIMWTVQEIQHERYINGNFLYYLRIG